MKKGMLVVLMLVSIAGCLQVSGCGGGFGEGVATGAAITGAVAGVREALVQREVDLNARYEVALNKYETVVTKVEKQAAGAQIKTLEEQLKENKQWQLIATLAEQGTKTDWNNPQAVASFSQLAAMLSFGGYFVKKIREVEKTK